jgi:hypothetical protein
MSLAAGTRLGPYETLATLGAGGMSESRPMASVCAARVAIEVFPVGGSSKRSTSSLRLPTFTSPCSSTSVPGTESMRDHKVAGHHGTAT